MIYDKNSFLAGLSVGKSLKGWSGAGEAEGYTPRVWNDEGVYDYFYIDYIRDVVNFSLGRFRHSTIISGATGELTPTNAEQISASVYKIYANIAGAGQVSVMGRKARGLKFPGNDDVPGFEANFWVDDEVLHQPGYMYDAFALQEHHPAGIENLTLGFFAGHGVFTVHDTVQISTAQTITETCTVTYR